MFVFKLAISVVLIFCHVANCCSTLVEITTTDGPIVGERITLDYLTPNVTLTRFLGIPYAKPPVGPLRFRRPVPPDQWTTPLDTLSWPNNCVQHPLFQDQFQNQNFTEDCLYLNVWSPPTGSSPTSLKPVIVWIHGGSFYYGGTSFDPYNGETLSALADAVIVTVNYRLSALGFMYSDAVPEIKGNQGLWDQAAALRWVQANINRFGGDPTQVTLMGESAGAWSTSVHILSPITRDLFKSAILMSGAALIKTTQTTQKFTQDFLVALRQVGCATAADQTISAQVVQCMEGLDANTLDNLVFIIKNRIDTHPLIVIDGEFLPDRPITMLTEGRHKQSLNLLLNTNEDEGSFFIANSGDSPQFNWAPTPVTKSQAENYLIDILANAGLNTNTVPNATVKAVYFSKFWLSNGADPAVQDQYRKEVSIAYGDMYIGCPTMEFAKQLYRNNPSQMKVHQWYFTAKLGALKVCPAWSGACHAEDVYPYFGVPIRRPEFYVDRERDISREVISIVKEFIRSGDVPNGNKWLPYYSLLNQVVAPYHIIGNTPPANDLESYKVNLKWLECNLLWNPFIYAGTFKSGT